MSLSSTQPTTRFAVVQMLGLDIEVHSGAAGPINGDAGRFASFVHGENGLVGATLPEVTREVSSTDAADYILSATIEHPGAWIVAIGPLTNIATALERDPALIDRISGISIMGGGTYGNISAAAEFNIHFDPEAAEIVFNSGAHYSVWFRCHTPTIGYRRARRCNGTDR